MKVPNCPVCGFNPHWVFSRHKEFKEKGYYRCPDCGMRVGAVPASERMTPEELSYMQQVNPANELGSCRTRFVYISHERYLQDIENLQPGDIALVAPNSKGLAKAYCYADGHWTLMSATDGDDFNVDEYVTRSEPDSLLK